MLAVYNQPVAPGTYYLDTETDGLNFDRKFRLAQLLPVEDNGKVYLFTDPVALAACPWDQITIRTHNAQFDLVTLKIACPNVPFPKVEQDTFIDALVNQLPDKGLKELVLSEFGYKMKTFEQVGVFTEDGPTVEQTAYAVDDVVQGNHLAKKFRTRYWENPRLQKVLDLEYRLSTVLAGMTYEGLRMDVAGWLKYEIDLEAEIAVAQVELDKVAGHPVNVDSPKQVQVLLFVEHGLVPVKLTPTKNPSTDADALSYFPGDPFVDAVQKVKSLISVRKYYKTLKPHVIDGHVHPQYNPIGWDEASSRIYSENPSVNQSPMAHRRFFIPKDGYRFWYIDLSAAEFYIACKDAGQQDLVDIYESGGDLHNFIAEKLLAKFPLTNLPTGMTPRDVVKIVVFAILYGSEGASVSRALKADVGEELVAEFFKLFPKLREAQERCHEEFRKYGVTHTIIGRPRKLGPYNPHTRRQSYNSRIQSSLADFMKYIMIKMQENLTAAASRIAVTVFDSLLLEVPLVVPEEVIRRWFAEAIAPLRFKFNYKLRNGMTWAEAQGE